MPGEGGERHGAEDLQGDRRAGDVPPIHMIGDPADRRRQEKERQELQQADQAELERRLLDPHGPSRDAVDLPPDDEDHAVLGEGGGQPRRPIGTEIGDGERVRVPSGHRAALSRRAKGRQAAP